MEINYEKDMEIDPNALDVEILNQTELGFAYCKQLATARYTLQLVEEKVKTVRSELIKKANETPAIMGTGIKPTAPNIEAFYRTNSAYKLVKTEWIDAKYECDMAEMAQQQICWGRKKSLESLISLHGQQYFAGPEVPRNLSLEDSITKKECKDVANKVAKKIKRSN